MGNPDLRFWWSRFMWENLQEQGIDCHEWLLPVIRGSVEVRTIYIGATQVRAGKTTKAGCHGGAVQFRFTLCFPRFLLLLGQKNSTALVSRLTCLRAGTRFNARGIDDEGNAANFVETEQVRIDLKQ